MSCAGSATVAAMCRKTASPAFMSEVPHPNSSPTPSGGAIPGGGHGVQVPGQQRTRRPAERRPGQHGVAVADHLDAGRLGAQRGLHLSAKRASFRDSLGTSTRAAVSSTGSACKSSAPQCPNVRERAPFPPEMGACVCSPATSTVRGATSALGVGLATLFRQIDPRHLVPGTGTDRRGDRGTNRLAESEATEEPAALTGRDDERGSETVIVRTVIGSLDECRRRLDAYLRLHLLSHRLVAPHELNTDGIFGILATWSGRIAGPARSRASRPAGGCAATDR